MKRVEYFSDKKRMILAIGGKQKFEKLDTNRTIKLNSEKLPLEKNF